MYLSHPVRRLRDDPIEGEVVELIVTAASREQTALETAIERAGGTVVDHLQFGALRVEIPQEQVDALCGLDGIESIETDHTVGIGGDAGEDIDSRSN